MGWKIAGGDDFALNVEVMEPALREELDHLYLMAIRASANATTAIFLLHEAHRKQPEALGTVHEFAASFVRTRKRALQGMLLTLEEKDRRLAGKIAEILETDTTVPFDFDEP